MRHTPCGCRSAHLAEVRSNFRYRQSHQCGERSNAAFGRQSAAGQTSLAPHDSKARLISVTTCRRFMAKPCTPHPHCAARAVIQAANPQWRGQGAAPLAFSWGSKGAILSRERMAPFPVSPTGVGKMSHHLQVVNQRPQHCLYFFPLPQGQDRCGRSSGPCGAAFSPCRRRRWRRRCRRPRARA